MLEISEGLVYSQAYISTTNELKRKETILVLNRRNHKTLQQFVNTYNTDDTSTKENARKYFLEHIIALIPPSQECKLLQTIKQEYLNFALGYLWEKRVPKNQIPLNPVFIRLTDQFFEKLNNRINPPPM